MGTLVACPICPPAIQSPISCPQITTQSFSCGVCTAAQPLCPCPPPCVPTRTGAHRPLAPLSAMQQVALQGCSSSQATPPRAGRRPSRTHAGVRVQAVFRWAGASTTARTPAALAGAAKTRTQCCALPMPPLAARTLAWCSLPSHRLISRPDVSPQAPTRLQQSLSTAVASEVSRPLAPGAEGSDGEHPDHTWFSPMYSITRAAACSAPLSWAGVSLGN